MTSIRRAPTSSTRASAPIGRACRTVRWSPDYAGIRPKLTGPGEPAADFMIEGPAEHGMAGLVNLFGIESPGLTSSLPLADDVMRDAESVWLKHA